MSNQLSTVNFRQFVLIILCIVVAGCQTISLTCSDITTSLSGGMIWTGNGFKQRDLEFNDGVFIQPGSCGAPQVNLDLTGHWLTPPFGDSHSHRLESAFMFPQFNQQFIREGIFYVLNPNADERLMKSILEKARQPATVEVATTYGGITSTFGHPQGGLSLVVSKFLYPGQDRDALEGHVFHSVDRVEDIAPVLNTLEEQGATVIKLFLHDSENFEKKKALVTPEAVAEGLDYSKTEFLFGLNPELVPRIVYEAKKRDLRVVAHIYSLADLRLAVNAGVDHLAHLPGTYVTDREQLAARQLTRNDAKRIMQRNISVTASYSARPEITPAELRDALVEIQARNIRLLHQAGVAVYPAADRYDQTAAFEYSYWLKHQFLPEQQALKYWIESSQFIFPGRRIGRLTPGSEASFLVFGKNPALDDNALTQIQQRYMNGVMLPTVDPDQEEAMHTD